MPPAPATLVFPEQLEPRAAGAGLLPAGRLAQAGPREPGLPPTDTEPQKPANRIHPLSSACSALKKGGERLSGAGLPSGSPRRQRQTRTSSPRGYCLGLKIQMQGRMLAVPRKEDRDPGGPRVHRVTGAGRARKCFSQYETRSRLCGPSSVAGWSSSLLLPLPV